MTSDKFIVDTFCSEVTSASEKQNFGFEVLKAVSVMEFYLTGYNPT
jgi:hypothetical protein